MRFINDMKVNTLGITSSTIALLEPEKIPTLQRINLTGESLDHSVVARWASHVELKNNYGLSECTQLTWGRRMFSGEKLSSQKRWTAIRHYICLYYGPRYLEPNTIPGSRRAVS